MRIAVLCCALAGCAIPAEKHAPDLSCNGQALPSMADPSVTISGRVIDSFSKDPVPGVPVEAHLLIPPSTDNTVLTVNTDGNGHFTKNQQTAGASLEVYLRATPSNYLETRYYPAVPVAHDLTTDVQVFTTENVGTLEAVGGITIDTTKANLLVTTVDCNDQPISGVSVSTEPAGTMVYFANGKPSTSATMTDEITGTALVINAPVGPMTITATINNASHTQMRPHMITAAAGVITQTEIQP